MSSPRAVALAHRYLLAVAVLEVVIAVVGAIVIALQAGSLAASFEVEASFFFGFSAIWALTFVFLAVVHYAAARSPKAAYTWKIVAIILGLDLTTLVLWPFAIPVLWMWLKRDVRDWYGATPGAEDA
jgi:hypothetical protein